MGEGRGKVAGSRDLGWRSDTDSCPTVRFNSIAMMRPNNVTTTALAYYIIKKNNV